jgi:hypothetical protein
MATSDTSSSQFPVVTPAEDALDAGWGDALPQPASVPAPAPTSAERAIGSSEEHPAETAEQAVKPPVAAPILEIKPPVAAPIQEVKPSAPAPVVESVPPASAPSLELSAAAADLDFDLPPDPLSLRVPEEDEPYLPVQTAGARTPSSPPPPAADQTLTGLGVPPVPAAVHRKETLVGLGIPDHVSPPAPIASPPPEVPQIDSEGSSLQPFAPTLPSPAGPVPARPAALPQPRQPESTRHEPAATKSAAESATTAQTVARPADTEMDQWARSVKTKRRRWAIVGGAVVGLVGVAVVAALALGRGEAGPEPVPSVASSPARVKNPQDLARVMAHEAETAQPTPAAASVPAQPAVAASASAAVPTGPVSIELEVLPAQTLVFHKGEKLGKAPLKIELKPGEKKDLFLARDGYRPQRVTIDGTEPKVSITMTPYEGAAGGDQAGQPPPASQPPRKPTRWEPEAFTEQ